MTIIGAMARIGMVWLATSQGISERSMARLCTISTARRMPSSMPKPKPSKVEESVTQL